MDIDTVGKASWTVNGSEFITTGEERISANGMALVFSPLHTSGSGRYTCTLALSVLENTSYIVHGLQQRSEEIIITVKSKVF